MFLLSFPALICVFIFNYIPLYGLTLAFRNFRPELGIFLSPWAKPLWYNFWFLQDPEFWYVLKNTVVIAGTKIIFLFPAPIILALLINEVALKWYKRVVQTITYMPHFISWVIMAGIFYKVLDFEPNSPINALLNLFGLGPVNIMGDEKMFLPVVIFSSMLKNVGWGTIIYLAAIMNIDPQLYEAAIIDGARKFTQIRKITIPCILPTISILFILQVPSLLVAGLNQIYNLMNPLTARAANITDIYILRVGLLQGQFAYATALGLVFGLAQLALVILANRFTNRSVGHGLW